MFLLSEFFQHLHWRSQREQRDPNLRAYLAWKPGIDREDIEAIFNILLVQGLMEQVELSDEDEGRGDWKLLVPKYTFAQYGI